MASASNGIGRGEEATFDLGIAKMRLLARATQTDNSFSLAEFRGGEGPWTVPHVHRRASESFFVLEGRFAFTIGDETIEARPGDYVLVPPETKHVLGAEAGGGSVLAIWVPGGLEEMFIELSKLSPGALLDPSVRAAISARHDSVPVQAMGG